MTYDVAAEGAPSPKIIGFVDPLPAADTGATWLPLGSALDVDARVFTYVAVSSASGGGITGLRFVHLNADTGAALGANDWSPEAAPGQPGGSIWRFAYAR